MHSFTNTVYEYMAYVDSSSVITYKYANGNTSQNAEDITGTCAQEGFRTLTVTNDLVLDSLCFSTCELCKTSGLSASDFKQYVKVYPNPANDYFVVDMSHPLPIDYVVMSISGKEIFKGNLPANHATQISCEGLVAGVYLLKISDQTFRILIQ
jgi:hypothetical protein